MLVKFEQSHMIQIAKKIELFQKKKKKNVILKLFLTNRWRHFVRRFCTWNNCLMLNHQFPDYHLSVFQKLWQPDTCNEVKSCTKHGRPN